MNIRLLIAITLSLAGVLTNAQVRPADQAAPDERKPDETGGNYRTWSIRSAEDARSAPGEVRTAAPLQRRISEIATGMNYWDGHSWVPSVAKFEITENGFDATRMQHVVSLHGNLNRVGSVSVETPDGIALHSSPVAIGLYDAASGESLIIARINNSAGVRVADNKVFYENAFVGLNGEGLCADVLYTIERGSFEQDVIIRGKLDPAAYGFPKETARIQIYTEFYQAPQPQRIRRPIRVEDREAVRAQMAKPDLVDDVLGFGECVIATGRAFPADVRPQEAAAPVAKEFVSRDGRTFLIESVEYVSVQKHFEQLPPCNPNDAAVKRDRSLRKRIDYVAIPTAAPRSNTVERVIADENLVRTASMNYQNRKGVVIDYIMTEGGTINTTKVFQGDTTYLVSGPVICNGAAIIEGGAVFKFKHNTTAPVGYVSIKFNNTITCKTTSYRPAIFTAVDDDSVGESMNGVSGSGYQQPVRTDGYANPALWIYNLSAQQLSNLRFTYCQEAIRVEGGSGNTLTHAQLVKCIRGIVITGGGGCGSSSCSVPITVNNGLFANVSSPVMSQRVNSTANFFHCTVQSSPAVSVMVAATASSACNFYNSSFANITTISSGSVAIGGSKNGFHASPQFGTLPVPSASYPFQAPVGGAGNYYLATDSLFRDAGTTVGISSSLLTELSKRTVDPPTFIAAGTSYPAGQIFAPRVSGDTGNPDLGYHYPILDYLASGLGVSGTGAPLILTNGVTMGFYGNSGFIVPDGGVVGIEGTATAMNKLVWYPSVQEQPVLLDNVATRFSKMIDLGTASGTAPGTLKPIVRMRFTEVAMLGSQQFLLSALPLTLNTLSIKDCWLRGTDISMAASLIPFPQIAVPVMTIWNSVLERSRVSSFIGYVSSSDTPLGGVFVNNLVWNSTFQLIYQAQGAAYQPTWTIQGNLFDSANASLSGNGNYQSLVSRSFNAFFNTPGTSLGGSGDVPLTALSYATGSHGWQWYINSSTPTLQNADASRTGGPAGLYHYTISTSPSGKEENSNVDIGFHYVALGGNELPIDTDADGRPDYLEDTNGNNTFEGGETDILDPDTDNDGVTDGGGLFFRWYVPTTF